MTPLSSSFANWKVFQTGLSFLSHRRNNAELLQESQHVEIRPRLDSLAVNKSVNRDASDAGRLTSRRNADEVPRVCAMRCPAGHHVIPFGNHILNGET